MNLPGGVYHWKEMNSNQWNAGACVRGCQLRSGTSSEKGGGHVPSATRRKRAQGRAHSNPHTQVGPNRHLSLHTRPHNNLSSFIILALGERNILQMIRLRSQIKTRFSKVSYVVEVGRLNRKFQLFCRANEKNNNNVSVGIQRFNGQGEILVSPHEMKYG